MTDTIQWPVIQVIDGDTFDMKVTKRGENNQNKYNNEERIRITDIDEPELRYPAGMRSKEKLERKLRNKKVLCYIQTRDNYSRLVANVKII